MFLQLHMWSNKTMAVEVEPTDTMGQVIDKIFEKLDMPVDKKDFWFSVKSRSICVDSPCTVEEAGWRDAQNIQMRARFRGSDDSEKSESDGSGAEN